jgi:type IV pilus secretin PilQ/predicted competence protein
MTKKFLTLFLLLTFHLPSSISLLPSAAYAAEGGVGAGVTASAGAATIEERLQQIITVEYKDADLASVLRSLALTYRLNLLTGPDVKGKVTINLQEITVEKALEAILKANGLIYSKKDGVIYISSGDASLVDVSTEVIQMKYLTATQAQNMARKMLSAKGDMKVNETANNIIVTDYRENIDKIRELLSQVDTAPKQVLIEAKIVDITSSDLKALGVTYNFNFTPAGDIKGLFSRSTRAQENLEGTINLPNQSSALTGGQIELNALSLKGFTLDATIDALVKDGKAHLLASPSIAVINGQEARIVIGERYPYKERTQTTSGTTETTKFVDIGTTLKVNPQINDDGYITMTLHPEVSSLEDELDAGPRITTREADTTVRVKAGETIVIGGLISQTDTSTFDKIPVLGDIPFLGKLFQRSVTDVSQKELAVFITPRILFSREEQRNLGLKQAEMENKYMLIDKVANLTLVDKMFDTALAMEKNEGVESVRKDELHRSTQAVSEFEIIYNQFPDSAKAPEAKYHVGMIQWKSLKDLKKAKNTFSTLIADYPRSVWAEEARKAYEQMTQEMVSGREEEEMQMDAVQNGRKQGNRGHILADR